MDLVIFYVRIPFDSDHMLQISAEQFVFDSLQNKKRKNDELGIWKKAIFNGIGFISKIDSMHRAVFHGRKLKN